jgi:CheY-like chemotaxis protein
VRRVLVVVRVRLHRELVGEWLAAAGAEAIWPEGPEQRMPDIDAILVDVACQQQAHEILVPWRHAYPQAAIVLASGRFLPADMANDAMARRLGATHILAKPFTRIDLWTALDLSRAH